MPQSLVGRGILYRSQNQKYTIAPGILRVTIKTPGFITFQWNSLRRILWLQNQ